MNTAEIPPTPFPLKGRHWEAVIRYVSESQKTNLRVKDDLYLAWALLSVTMAFLAVVYVFGKTFWWSVPVKGSLGSKLCVNGWENKPPARTMSQHVAGSGVGGMQVQGQRLRALQDLSTFLCTVMERLNVQQVLDYLSDVCTWVFTKNKRSMIKTVILASTKDVVRMPSGKVKPAKITK